MTIHTATPTANNTDSTQPWYKEGWLWFVISIPAVSVPLGVAMIVIALNTNNSLVVDDYYVQGKTINQRIDRDRHAARHDISAATVASANGLRLSLSSRSSTFIFPDQLQLRWVHITQADQDRALRLVRIGQSSQYIGRWPEPGKLNSVDDKPVYRLHLSPPDKQWRLVGKLSGILQAQRLNASVTAD